MNYQQRQENQITAMNHTRKMGELYSKEIANSIQESKVYTECNQFDPKLGWTKDPIPTEQILARLDSVSAVKKFSGNGKLCVLNFASYKKPGGGFITGSIAQEECLCHESILYNVISSNILKPYYEYNNAHLNYGHYKNRAIYSPNIVFTNLNDELVCKADVLTCAAPNYCFKIQQRVSAKSNLQALKSRIEYVKKILMDNHVEIAILGAYGCGVFGQDPCVVAKLFLDTFKADNGSIRKVIYAIPGGRNYDAFNRVFKYGR